MENQIKQMLMKNDLFKEINGVYTRRTLSGKGREQVGRAMMVVIEGGDGEDGEDGSNGGSEDDLGSVADDDDDGEDMTAVWTALDVSLFTLGLCQVNEPSPVPICRGSSRWHSRVEPGEQVLSLGLCQM